MGMIFSLAEHLVFEDTKITKDVGHFDHGSYVRQTISWKENYYGYDEPRNLRLTSIECCGWVEVSSLSYLKDSKKKQEILLVLMKEQLIIPRNGWSKKEDQETFFTLMAVTANQPSESEWLEKNGWQKLPSFFNPNTNNTCNPYMFDPRRNK